MTEESIQKGKRSSEMGDGDGSISHFSHPEHELVKRHHIGPFLCDMCWEDLSGLAYLCPAGCDFGIHADTCAGNPQTLLSPEHHPHELELVQIPRDATRVCDVCAGDCTGGCFVYRCPPCDFDMHPRCARLPPVVRSARHDQHDLTLVALADEGRCAAPACHRAGAWYYRCTVCSDLEFHVSCAGAGAGGDEGNAAAAAGAPAGAGDVLIASLEAQRDMNYRLAIAKIQASGAQSIAELAGVYRTRRYY